MTAVAVLPQKDGTVSVLPLDRRRLAVPSRPLLFRTDGTVENTERNSTERMFLLGHVIVYVTNPIKVSKIHGPSKFCASNVLNNPVKDQNIVCETNYLFE